MTTQAVDGKKDDWTPLLTYRYLRMILVPRPSSSSWQRCSRPPPEGVSATPSATLPGTGPGCVRRRLDGVWRLHHRLQGSVQARGLRAQLRRIQRILRCARPEQLHRRPQHGCHDIAHYRRCRHPRAAADQPAVRSHRVPDHFGPRHLLRLQVDELERSTWGKDETKFASALVVVMGHRGLPSGHRGGRFAGRETLFGLSIFGILHFTAASLLIANLSFAAASHAFR